MSETLVNTIDGDKLYAERAVKDASGNSISETYATKSEIPVVDQAYDATSTNAQSGVAVAEALSNVPSPLSAGNGIDIYNNVISAKADGSSITYNANGELESHNTLIAGGGIDIYNNVISAKADGTTITYNANGELQATVSGGVTDVTVDGTSVVNGQGVAEITMPTFTQVNSDWNASSGVAEILNKPANLVQDANYVHTDENFTSAEKTKLAGIATGAEVNVQADWNESSSSSDAYIQNKPDLSIYAQSANLATVATSGDYDDLSGKPTIPAAQVNSDWNASSGVSEILNKPTLATVATSGDYDDLTNKPTISNVPSVGSADDGKALVAHYSGGSGTYSWDSLPSGIFPVEYGVTTYAQITDALAAGKLPVLKYVSDSSSSYTAVFSVVLPSSYHFTVTSYTDSSYGENLGVRGFTITNHDIWSFDISTTSHFQADWNQTNGGFLNYIRNKPSLATVATSGDYDDLTNKPSIPAAQVNSDWNASSGVAEILNKPNLATVATTGAYSDLSGTPNLATVATSGSYADLTNTPSIPTIGTITL